MNHLTRQVAMLSAVLLVVAGCSRAESPGEVAHYVAQAQQEGADDRAKAQANSSEDRTDANRAVNETASQSDYDVAIAKAEAEHKVAIESCETLAGDVQKPCKNAADARFATDKAAAEREKSMGG